MSYVLHFIIESMQGEKETKRKKYAKNSTFDDYTYTFWQKERDIRMTRSFREILVIQSSTHSLTWKYERIALLCLLRITIRWSLLFDITLRSITSRVPQRFISNWRFLIALDFNYDFDHVALLLFRSIVDYRSFLHCRTSIQHRHLQKYFIILDKGNRAFLLQK